MSSSPKEIELKLEVPPQAQETLRKSPAPEGFTASRAVTKTLQSIYFDTADQALRRARISLRVRKVGQSWVQTAKIGTGVIGGMSSAVEAEHPVDGRAIDLTVIEDPQVLRHLVETINCAPLAETFETIIKRTTRVLTAEDGSRIEVAFDVGDIKAGERSAPLAEVELELLEGASGNLYAAARGLLEDTPFHFSPYSKAERGFRLAGGESSGADAPSLARKVVLTASESVEHAFRSVLRSCLEQIAHNRMAMITSDDPEGPHQLRVGLRRLRSAFRLFRPVLNSLTFQPLDASARTLAGKVGELRDLDVLASEIVAPLSDHAPQNLSLDPLLKHLANTRVSCRNELIDYLQSTEINAFLFSLAAYTEGRGWLDAENFDQTTLLAAPISAFARKAQNKQWRKVAKHGSGIEEMSVPERHEMRKALKKLRYGIEFFGSLYPKAEVKPFLKRMKKLQDIFGYLNDVAMAEKLLDLPSAKGAGASDTSLAMGFAIGWHEAQATQMWRHAKDYWTETKGAPKFWR
ncbi:CYTH and CHAD domain-containing protein [Roseibium polysiphoniae]|uniref:CYTH and CHAD domain-containing protein n=1 Tax=Roseibium polysiphoniae TaxID=2571221 RepID=UPI003299E195